jgi:hypothetical protein
MDGDGVGERDERERQRHVQQVQPLPGTLAADQQRPPAAVMPSSTSATLKAAKAAGGGSWPDQAHRALPATTAKAARPEVIPPG